MFSEENTTEAFFNTMEPDKIINTGGEGTSSGEKPETGKPSEPQRITSIKPIKKLIRAGRKPSETDGVETMSSLDKALAKQEQANLEANRIAASDPELQGKTRFQARAGEVAMALSAAVIGSCATVAIMIPNGLTFGGITGIARLVQTYTGWNYSLIYYALAMVIACIVWVSLGFRELRKILMMSLAYPAIMLVIELSGIQFVTEDKLLAAVFTGVVMGVSNGLTFKAGFSSGGTDSLAKVIKYKRLPHLAINDITFALNAVIVIASAILLGLNIALYAIITIYVSMKVGEAVMYGLSTKIVELEIIPGDADALTKYIMEELGRGVSSVEITGEYTGDKRKQLKILCSPRESFLIKRHLAKNDPKSFVAVIGVNSVWGVGRGFSDIRSME